MRFFRKKSDPTSHQEYLDGLITSIRQARREEEEKPGLHAFVEDDEFYPGDQKTMPPRIPPGAAKPGAKSEPALDKSEAEALASLEAYLSALNAAEAARAEQDEEGGEPR